jgi:5-formyltetrahydrofolate cyclo-ligase
MKKEIRESMLNRRNSLSKEEILERSKKIEQNLSNLKQYKEAKNVMFFVSFGSEVHTHEMIKEALKSKTVIIPKVLNNEIEPSLIIDFDNLIPSGKFGILEPIEAMKIAYKNIDLILVAGIAFDNEGYRLGYGLGYYDRFLAKLPKALKIGLCFDLQIADRLPREAHDVPVDIVVTDEEVIKCK